MYSTFVVPGKFRTSLVQDGDYQLARVSYLPLGFVSLITNMFGTCEPVHWEVANFSVDLNAKYRIVKMYSMAPVQ